MTFVCVYFGFKKKNWYVITLALFSLSDIHRQAMLLCFLDLWIY